MGRLVAHIRSLGSGGSAPLTPYCQHARFCPCKISLVRLRMSGARLAHPCSSLLHCFASANAQGNVMGRSPRSRTLSGHYLDAPSGNAAHCAPGNTSYRRPYAMGRRPLALTLQCCRSRADADDERAPEPCAADADAEAIPSGTAAIRDREAISAYRRSVASRQVVRVGPFSSAKCTRSACTATSAQYPPTRGSPRSRLTRRLALLRPVPGFGSGAFPSAPSPHCGRAGARRCSHTPSSHRYSRGDRSRSK